METEAGAIAGNKMTAADEAGGNNLGTFTPSSGTNTDTVPVVQKTPLSVMSSSLKDRLKKCGRYHPATPPSSRQNASLSSQIKPLSSGLQSSPTSGQPYSSSQTHYSSPAGIKRRLPQPRNILVEKSNFCSPCISTSNSSVEEQTGDKMCAMNAQDDKDRNEDSQSSGDQVVSASRHNLMTDDFQAQSSQAVVRLSQPMSSTRDGQALSSAGDASVSEGPFGDRKVWSAMTAQSQDGPESASCEDLRATKKQFSTQLTERTEVLRKLNMVKTYRSKNDLHHLQGLIDKWRSACQQAVLDLHQLTPDPRPSLTQLVQQLGIDTKLVCYNEEEECFDAT